MWQPDADKRQKGLSQLDAAIRLLLGGDVLGSGRANDYHATGKAVVHNVRLRALSSHSSIPDAKDLLLNQEIREWINRYEPAEAASEGKTLERKFGAQSARILWAAEVWYRIKKHWVLELQRRIAASRTGDLCRLNR